MKLISSLRDKISSGKSRITKLNSDNEYLEKLRLEKEAQEQKLADEIRTSQLENEERARVNDLMVCAHNLHFEIKTRYETLGKKCSVDLATLSDHEVLEKKGGKKVFTLN